MRDEDEWDNSRDNTDGADFVARLSGSEERSADIAGGQSCLSVGAPELLPHCLLVRTFWSFKEAERFNRKVIAEVTSRVTLRPFGKHYQVAYHANSSSPLRHYRAHCHYSTHEEYFIIRQYMMWTPVSELAIKLDRNSRTVAAWLANHGYRVIERNPTFGVGQLEFRAPDICRQIGHGCLEGDTAELLISIGVICDTTPAQNEMIASGCGTALLALTPDDKKRLLRFALDYNELSTAYDLASDIGRHGLAYILALQMRDPFKALRALKRMRITHPQLRSAMIATANFIRFELATTLPDFLQKWFNHANVGRGTWEASRWDPCPEGRTIIERLLLVLGDSAYGWPADLLTIVRIINHGAYTVEELRRSKNHFAAWLSADLMRVAAAREDSYNVRVEIAETKLAAFNALDANYVPDLARLLTDLAAVLTCDLDLANTVKHNMAGAGPYFVELDPDAEIGVAAT